MDCTQKTKNNRLPKYGRPKMSEMHKYYLQVSISIMQNFVTALTQQFYSLYACVWVYVCSVPNCVSLYSAIIIANKLE